MSSEAKHPSDDRRKQTKTAIDRLLEERQEVLVCYEQVAGIQPYNEKNKNPELLQKFSQLLMDYIARRYISDRDCQAAAADRARA